jgi:hypothetical protein
MSCSSSSENRALSFSCVAEHVLFANLCGFLPDEIPSEDNHKQFAVAHRPDIWDALHCTAILLALAGKALDVMLFSLSSSLLDILRTRS